MLHFKTPFSTWTLVNLLILLSLLALFLSLSFHQIVNFDIWWHLRTGRYIVENLSVPRSDMYTFTYPGSRWIDLHWLFQGAAYSIYSSLGPDGLTAFQTLILGAAFLLISSAPPKRPPFAISGIFILCAIFVCEERFIVRPEIFTLLFTAVYIFALARGSRRLLSLIPLFQIIWVNTGGLFIIGLVILYLHLIGEAIQGRLSRGRRGGKRQSIKGLAAVALISTAACLINPFGWEGFIFPLKLFSRIGGAHNIFSMSIGEFRAPLSVGPLAGAGPLSGAIRILRALLSGEVTHSVFFFKILVALSALSIILNARKLRVSSLLVYGAFLYLALSARRNMALFAFAALPFSIENLASFWERLGAKKRLDTILRGGGAAIIIAVVLLEVPAVLSGRYYMEDNITKRFGRGFSPMMYPIRAAGFVRSSPVGGRIFNDLASGGLLIWELSPRRKVFIDGRLEVMPEEFYRAYFAIISRPEESFADLAARYDIQTVILNHRAVGRKLLNYFYKSPLWEPVFFDAVGIVFCKKTPENAAFIGEHAVDFSSPPREEAVYRDFPYGRFYRGNFFMTLGLYDLAFDEYREGLLAYPGYAPGYNALGRIHEERGDIGKARSLYRRALETDPSLFEAHLNLGNLEIEQGEPEKARVHYSRALAIDPSSLDALTNMGTALARTGDIDGAIEEYKRALAVAPSSEAAARNLRIMLKRARNSP